MASEWSRVLESIRGRVSAHDFNQWFKQISFQSASGGRVVLAVADSFVRDWIVDHYMHLLEAEVSRAFGAGSAIEITVMERERYSPKQASAPKASIRDKSSELLIERYTFASFVPAPSNQLAHAAALAVAEGPAKAYNPLYIYGGVGLGKTHLVMAIGNEIRRRHQSLQVKFVPSQTFIRDVIAGVQHKSMDEFRATYRDACDVLLLDDIQFLINKERCQEEFFHAFNALYGVGRQIVVTSDCLPQDLDGLDERLRSRFQWGLLADIQPPEYETRVAILLAKAERDEIELPQDVAGYLASLFRSNVRELEGALNRVAACAKLEAAHIDMALARRSVAPLIKEERRVTIQLIQKQVASFYNLKVTDLKSARRHRAVSVPRQLAMYICRKHTGHSFPEIGMEFGNRDHSTVIAAVSRVEKLLATDGALHRAAEELEKQLELA